MKKLKLVLIIGLLILVSPVFSQEKDIDVMVRKIFGVLQHKDEKGFTGLFPDAATTKEFVRKIFAKDIAEGNGGQLNELFDQLTDSLLRKKYSESFTEAIEKGEKRGIDWSKTKFDKYMADSSFQDEMKVSVLQGKIYFNTEDEKYFLAFKETIWFENRGWYGVSIERIDELSKENDPEEFDWGTVDSAMVAMDTAMAIPDTAVTIPAEKPAAKQKINPKQPAKNKAPKDKSQTPAKKPE